MKMYYAEIGLSSGSIRIEFEGPNDLCSDDDVFNMAVEELIKETDYAKLQVWGDA